MISRNWFVVLYCSIAFIISGCDKGGSSSGASSNNGWSSYYVLEPAELPTCDANVEGRLYYIESSQNFQACASGNWRVVDIKGSDGSNGSDGLTIVENKKIPAIATDLCTSTIPGEYCFFDGGMFLKYSDGSILFVANFYYSMTYNDSDGDPQSERWHNNQTLYVPADTTAIRELGLMSRGSVVARLWLLYSPTATKPFALVHDTNQNNSVDGTDELVAEISLENW